MSLNPRPAVLPATARVARASPSTCVTSDMPDCGPARTGPSEASAPRGERRARPHEWSVTIKSSTARPVLRYSMPVPQKRLEGIDYSDPDPVVFVTLRAHPGTAPLVDDRLASAVFHELHLMRTRQGVSLYAYCRMPVLPPVSGWLRSSAGKYACGHTDTPRAC